MKLDRKEPKRILFVTTSFPRHENDYAGSFVYRFAKYLQQSGIDLHVVAPGDENARSSEFLSGVKVSRVTYFYPRSSQRLCYDGGGIFSNLRNSWLARLQLPFLVAAMTLKVAKEIKHVDVIHCHWLPTVWFVSIALFMVRRKKTIVFTNWGSDTRLLPIWLVKRSLRGVDLCVSTAAETDEHLKSAGIDNFRKVMAPIDEERFDRDSVSTEALEKELDITNPVISFVGRLNYFKDPITFIDACDQLRSLGQKFTAIVAGDGDLRIACEQKIKALGLEDHVFLLGNRSDTNAILKLSSVMVHISPIENTWANAIAEAMFIGCPVVLTDVGYTRATFTDGENCCFVSPKDPSELAIKLRDIIVSEELQKCLSDGAKKLLIAQKKDKGSIVKLLRSAYADSCNYNAEK